MTDFDAAPDETGAPDYLQDSAALLSKKWHPVLITTLAGSDGLGFSDLETRLDGISAKVLTDALEQLQDHEIVERTEVSQSPLRVEYTLTDRGVEFEAVIQSLADWGETYLAGDAEEQVVLVADDDRRVVTMHTSWLEDEYTVRTAHDGEETLRELDTEVDVLVLDRRMPGLSGDEVLDWVRSQRYGCRVVMVTSEEPELEILDMGFDEYLTKPVLQDELRAVVSDLFERAHYDTEVREYLALRSKLAVLEAEYPAGDLTASEEYDQYQQRLDTLEGKVDDVAERAPRTLGDVDVGSSR